MVEDLANIILLFKGVEKRIIMYRFEPFTCTHNLTTDDVRNWALRAMLKDATDNWPISKELINAVEEIIKENRQLKEENEYLKLSNPEQNLEHFRIVKENKRKIDNLRKHNKRLKAELKRANDFICSLESR